MRKLIFAVAAAATLAASPAADARQQNDIAGSGYAQSGYAEEAQREARLADLNELIAWVDQMEAALDSGSLLLVRPGAMDGGLRAALLPVDRDEVIRMIRIKVALGEITSEQGTAILLEMAADTVRHRRTLRNLRDGLVGQRRSLRGQTLQPWERGQPPAARATPAAPPAPQRSACPAATRWRIDVQGSQYSYNFMLVIREDGTAAVLMASGQVMDWVQTQARISGNSLTLNTRDAQGSGSLTATLTPDCLRGTGQSSAYNGNNGPATLTRLN